MTMRFHPPTAAAIAAPILRLASVSKSYHTIDGTVVTAVARADLDVAPGEFVSIVGASGCGKTTLLNMVAGLIRPSGGEILFQGEPVTGPSSGMGLIFQRPVLMPWRRVIDNVMLPVEVMGLKPRAHYRDRAFDLLATVGLKGFENAYPRELSGGMQQRAAIARALVYDTKVLMLDEPFAALDAITRDELNIELMRIWAATGGTVLFVTHNIPEAVLLSDRIVVMTARPGTVREIVPVNIARPRSLALFGDPTFGGIVSYIRSLLDRTG